MRDGCFVCRPTRPKKWELGSGSFTGEASISGAEQRKSVGGALNTLAYKQIVYTDTRKLANPPKNHPVVFAV